MLSTRRKLNLLNNIMTTFNTALELSRYEWLRAARPTKSSGKINNSCSQRSRTTLEPLVSPPKDTERSS
jgi:hypothetical protein